MKDIWQVVDAKEKQRDVIEQEIKALYVAAALLHEDDSKERTPREQGCYVNSVPKFDLRDSSVQQPSWIEDSPVPAYASKPEPTPIPPAEPNHAVEIQKQHISDLRVLIDKSEARENVLLDLVKMVMEEKFFRPTITGPRADNRTTPAIPAEHLSDVEAFDEKADAEQSEAEGSRFTELQSEFNSILTEHKEAHQE